MIIKSIVYYFVVCSLQYWSASHFKIFGVSLDLPFMAVFVSTSLFSPTHSMIFSFMLGFFSDFSSWGHFGLYCLSYVLISYFLNVLKNRTDLNSTFSRNLFLLLFLYFNFIFYSFFYFAIYKLWFFGWKDFFIAPFFNLIFFEIFYRISQRYLSEKKCL